MPIQKNSEAVRLSPVDGVPDNVALKLKMIAASKNVSLNELRRNLYEAAANEFDEAETLADMLKRNAGPVSLDMDSGVTG